MIIFFSCSKKVLVIEKKQDNLSIIKEITPDPEKYWYLKDITLDSINGISFERASDLVAKKTIKDTVVVAIIDSDLDVNHKYFKNHVWVNKDEVPNNNIDDDKNGYIDDINGWNFLSNQNGQYIDFYHFESTRILKLLNPLLKNNTDTISALGDKYALYKNSLKDYESQLNFVKRRQKQGSFLAGTYDKAYKLVESYFPNKDYDVKKLDSLYLSLKDSDNEKARLVYYVSDCIKYDITKEWIETYNSNTNNIVQKCLNINYDEREITRDNPSDILDSIYGSPKLLNNLSMSRHATQVAGIITNHNNKEFLKIMPIVISAHGDEHDKDIAISIKYAVNNGAKVINMSLGKELSLHEKWITDAIKYAESKDVLIVYAAGNDAKNIDNLNNKYYPNDVDESGNEIADNFIAVGASTKSIDENLIANFSNYNKEHIDIFAPGDQIFVYSPDGEDFYNRGTSLAAPMVSKTAALIRSHYPNLTASQVKKIILESGVSHDIMVNKPSTSKGKELVPFSSLSKSGKIVNAYNALLMAEKVSKKKSK